MLNDRVGRKGAERTVRNCATTIMRDHAYAQGALVRRSQRFESPAKISPGRAAEGLYTERVCGNGGVANAKRATMREAPPPSRLSPCWHVRRHVSPEPGWVSMGAARSNAHAPSHARVQESAGVGGNRKAARTGSNSTYVAFRELGGREPATADGRTHVRAHLPESLERPGEPGEPQSGRRQGGGRSVPRQDVSKTVSRCQI